MSFLFQPCPFSHVGSFMRVSAMPASAVEHKWRVAQPHVVAAGELACAVDPLAADEAAVLAGQVAQDETPVLRHDSGVAARDGGVGDHDIIVVARPSVVGACGCNSWRRPSASTRHAVAIRSAMWRPAAEWADTGAVPAFLAHNGRNASPALARLR